MAAQVVLSCLEPFPTHLNPCLDVLIQESHFRRAFNSSGSAVTVLFTPTQLDHPLQRRLLLCAHATAVQTHAPAVQTHAPAVQTHATAVQTHATAVQTADCGGDGPHTPMKVFVTRVFLRHHHLQQNTGGTVRLLTPVALTKVVIGARSRHSFKWANSDKFANGLQVLASSGQVILAREGDVLRLPSHPLLGDDMSLLDLVVLQCAPVTQGRITGGSGVVVTDAWDSPDSVSLARPLTKVLVSDFAHFSNSLCRGGSLLDNSLCRGGSLLDNSLCRGGSLLDNSLCRGGSLLDNSLCRGGSLLDNRNPLSPSFSDFLRALEGRIDVRVVNVCPLIRQNCLTGKDWDSTVFVSRNLLLKLGLFNHEWVVLSVLNPLEKCVAGVSSRLECLQTIGVEDGEKPLSKVRLASVVVLDFTQCPELEVNDTYGLISTTHWFNLSAGETVPTGTRTLRIKRWNKSPPLAESPPSHSTCRTASPRFATELHIEPIISPDYDSQGCCDDLLTRHFTTARLVAKGDVMAVCSENHAEEKDNISDRDQRCPVRYFKVRKVFGCVADEEEVTGDFLADKRHTSLYLGGSTNSPVPFCWFWGTSSLWSSLAPSGLGSTVDKCINIIQPHLKNRSCTSLGRCNILLQGARGCGKVTSVRAACRRLHLHLVQVNCVSLCADTAASCEVKMRATFQKAEALHPCVLLLRNLQYLGQPREGDDEDSRVQASLFQLLTTTCTRVVVMATVSRPQELSSDVMAAFVHQVAIESASEAQRKAMLAGLTMGVPLAKDVSLDLLAKYTSGFVLGDLRSLLAEAGRTAYRRLQTTCSSMEPWGQLEVDLCSCGVHIQAQDFTAALDTLQESLSQAVGAPKIPSVRWQEVGGLEEVKQEILNTIQLPLERPELLSLGLHRVGLLLYGPPGTGKTLLAKAVATECSMTFLSIKGPELINMFVGQSEENIREVFSRARVAAPCVVFFDELDSLAPSRGRSGDSGGVMDRVVSQLLAELDGLHTTRGVFVIGATNRPDLLDQALLRPGRFDKLVYVGISSDRESQLQVLKAITAKFHLEPGVCLDELLDRGPSKLSGADLYALCSEAMTAAVKRKIALISNGLDREDSPLLLSSEDFSSALKSLQPSVSDQELLKYEYILQKLTAK